MTDPIADMLTRVRNAANARHNRVDVPSSKMKVAIAKILQEEGFIQGTRQIQDEKQGVLRIFLKYGQERESAIQGLQRISTPGRRIYVSRNDLPRVKGGYGVAIVSTSQGLMTGVDARQKGLGGEIVCHVW
jgi:small subunit ribosomal protein S8